MYIKCFGLEFTDLLFASLPPFVNHVTKFSQGETINLPSTCIDGWEINANKPGSATTAALHLSFLASFPPRLFAGGVFIQASANAETIWSARVTPSR